MVSDDYGALAEVIIPKMPKFKFGKDRVSAFRNIVKLRCEKFEWSKFCVVMIRLNAHMISSVVLLFFFSPIFDRLPLLIHLFEGAHHQLLYEHAFGEFFVIKYLVLFYNRWVLRVLDVVKYLARLPSRFTDDF